MPQGFHWAGKAYSIRLEFIIPWYSAACRGAVHCCFWMTSFTCRLQVRQWSSSVDTSFPPDDPLPVQLSKQRRHKHCFDRQSRQRKSAAQICPAVNRRDIVSADISTRMFVFFSFSIVSIVILSNFDCSLYMNSSHSRRCSDNYVLLDSGWSCFLWERYQVPYLP